MASDARIAVMIKRIEFHQSAHLVWLDRRGDLDSCTAHSPRAAALTQRLPAGWRIVGTFVPGVEFRTLAAAVRAGS